jgi:tRNA pseudouridine55 synthase
VELFSGCKQIKIRTDKQLRTSQKIQNWTCGTLDPLATGLLLVCTGNSQRELELQGQAKEYTGTFL